MRYNLDELTKESIIALTWHGEDTRILIEGEGVKRDIKTGDTVEVALEQAKTLLKYSHKWTLKGDEPIEQPFERAQKAANDRQEAMMRRRTAKKGEADNSEDEPAVDVAVLTEADIDAMETKKEILATFKKLDIKVNKNASLEELKVVLKEKLAEIAADAEEVPADDSEDENEETDEDAPEEDGDAEEGEETKD